MKEGESLLKGTDFIALKYRATKRHVGEFAANHHDEIIRWGITMTVASVAAVTVYERYKHREKFVKK
jgi:hypothetical protein